MQVTGLGNPKLLERVSIVLKELHALFRRFDKDGDGIVTKDEFFEVRLACIASHALCFLLDDWLYVQH